LNRAQRTNSCALKNGAIERSTLSSQIHWHLSVRRLAPIYVIEAD